MKSQLDSLNGYEIIVNHYEEYKGRLNKTNKKYLNSVMKELENMESSAHARSEAKVKASSLLIKLEDLGVKE